MNKNKVNLNEDEKQEAALDLQAILEYEEAIQKGVVKLYSHDEVKKKLGI